MATTGARDRAHGTTVRRASNVEQRGKRASQARARTRAEGKTPRSGSTLNSIADEMDAEYTRGERAGYRKGLRTGRPAPPSQARMREYNRQQRAQARTRTVNDALPVPSLGGPLDPAHGRTLILVFVSLSALGAMARDVVIGNPNPTSTAATTAKNTAPVVKTPQHLRSLAGVFVVGTIALIVNELAPQFGVAMAGVLALDVGMSVFAPQRAAGGAVQPAVFDRLGSALFAGGTPITTASSSAPSPSSIPLATPHNTPKAA
jgi:hypothetical protein